MIDTTVILAPGEQTIISDSLVFSCSDVEGARGQSYTIMAAADAHVDDAGACPVFQIQSQTCFDDLANDDNDSSDNRVTTNGYTVK